MREQVFKSGPFAGFSVNDEFAKAASRETPVVFNFGPVSWPDQLSPTPLALGQFKPGQKITGPVNYKADVLIVLYTDLETRALLDVFTGHNEWSAKRKATWNPYAHNFAKLKKNIAGINDNDALKSGEFGFLSAVAIGNQTVVLFKTELHAKVNGNKLPILAVVQQLVAELQPSLVISTGTAGGVGSVLNCGDVAITETARFDVRSIYPSAGQINSLSDSQKALANSVPINDSYLRFAAENLTKLTLPALAKCYGEFSNRDGFSFLKKNTTAPAIYTTNINPVPGPIPMAIVTADFLSADDSNDTEGLQQLGIMTDNDDAFTFFAISELPANQQPKWLSVRNASDPQVSVSSQSSGGSDTQQLSALAGAIFGVYQYVTTINSALACWAIVAGNARPSRITTATRSNSFGAKPPASGLRIPISNVYGGGDYTAQLLIGSQKTPVNVILDTGSSTVAVKASKYNPKDDSDFKPTVYAQEVQYGTGGWAGPLVTTNLAMGSGNQALTLQNAYLAIADDQLPHNFGAADGILGLAYTTLNQAYNLSAYLEEQKITPEESYPWPFPISNSPAALSQLQSIFQNLRNDDIPPYFDQLESQGLVANKFAFYALRSFPSYATKNLAKNPLNTGFFILGGGEEQTDLYSGEFVSVDVLDDDWYNVNLIAVQVGTAAPVKAAPLPTRFKQSQKSNAIVDSGTNSLFLATDVYQSVLAGLAAANANYPKLIKQAAQDGIATSQLKLNQWPPIHFILTGETGAEVTLTVTPESYWQVDFPKAGYALFNIGNGGLPQSILGLPLMNNYYTVFDRSLDSYGAVRFAPIKTG